jgi:hypothetical protein
VKILSWKPIVLVLSLLMASGTLSSAQEVGTGPSPTERKADKLPGVELSQGITEVTGVAISPLLGVSSVGAWRYFRTEEAKRDALPWFCHPAAWGCGFGILALCFLKDTLGTAMPGILKKPFDMVELFENKASALVASSAFVPVIVKEVMTHFADGKSGEMTTALLLPIASITGASVVSVSMFVVMTFASIVAFFAVWLTGHAINVLIILSPFSLVDALLKLSRFAVLLVIGLAYLIAPVVAAGLCVLLILVALWLAPATLRLAVFGSRYAGDVLLPWIGRRRAVDERPHAFTIGRSLGLPARTPGHLTLSENGSIEFRYRPWMIGSEKVIPLPEGRPLLLKGLISPTVAVSSTGDESGVKMLLLLPRYRGREENLRTHFRFHDIRDHALGRGIAVVRTWWHEQGRGSKTSNEVIL